MDGIGTTAVQEATSLKQRLVARLLGKKDIPILAARPADVLAVPSVTRRRVADYRQASVAA